MPFAATGLSKISNLGAVGTGKGSVRALWSHVTNDADSVVETTGYFNDKVEDMVVGDVIYASIDLDGTPELKVYMVTANDGTDVTIALQAVT